MIVYRIGRTKFAEDLSGEGARLHGGRWNHKGIPCIYTASTRALALLEYTVNINIDYIPRALSITAIEVPDDIFELTVDKLPGNWREAPAPSSTKDFGSQLLSKASHLVIKVPSSVLPEEYNYIINPAHGLMKKCKIITVKDFVYDVRIKLF